MSPIKSLRTLCRLILTVAYMLSLDHLAAAQFETRSFEPTVQAPWGALVADFNHDGKLDLAVTTCNSADQVGIMLGNGDGTFQPPVSYNVEACPGVPVAGDFNGDGNLDLAVAIYKQNGQFNALAVLLGNGDGTFRNPSYVPTPPFPYFVQVGDFNNDGILDLLTIEPSPNVLSVSLGNGDGTFQPYIESPIPLRDYAIAVGDFNNDGRLDVAGTFEFGSASSVQIMLGNGNGTFTYSQSYLVPDPAAITAARLTASNNVDLVVANDSAVVANGISVLLGNGDGTFQPAVNYPTASPTWVAVGDLDGDGVPDIAVANIFALNSLYESSVSVLKGNGDGTFQPGISYRTGQQTRFVGLGDLNGDRKVDIVAPSYQLDNVFVLLNSGVVSFSPSTPLNFKKQAVGTTSNPQTVTLTNTGTTALKIASMKASTEFAVTSTCGSSVAAGANCTISATFSPTKKGAVQGTISIIDSASSKPQVIELLGTGT